MNKLSRKIEKHIGQYNSTRLEMGKHEDDIKLIKNTHINNLYDIANRTSSEFSKEIKGLKEQLTQEISQMNTSCSKEIKHTNSKVKEQDDVLAELNMTMSTKINQVTSQVIII